MAFAEAHRRPSDFREIVLGAALAVAPRVVRPGHFRLLWLAWVRALPVSEILRVLDWPAAAGHRLRESLRRISGKVEAALLDALRRRLPGTWGRGDPKAMAAEASEALRDVAEGR
jgi:hypothetical protein